METALNKDKTDQAIIFCIEDEQDLRELIAEELSEAGYFVVELNDGKEAIEALDTCRPDLILCDVAMPRMGGYEFLQYLHEHRSDLMDVPFVFLTAQDGSGQIVKGKYAGADDYLVKPINFDLMLATLEARLRQVERLRQQLDRHSRSVVVQSTLNANKIVQRIAKTFDLINAGIILLDAQARIIFKNNAAEKIVLAQNSPELVAMIRQDKGHSYLIHSAFNEAIVAAQTGDDYTEFLSLARNDGQRDMLLSICALDGLHGKQDDPMVVLFFSQSDRQDVAPIKALAALFQLTPTESRVAWAFAQGMRPDEIAEHFSISKTTVAFHKRNIFQKTHTNRQADLITLLLALPTAPS